MSALIFVCGQGSNPLASRDDVESHVLSSRPGKTDVDPLLAALAGRRLIVAGSDADLAAVVVRLLRTERLNTTAIGYLPVNSKSRIASLWGIPIDQKQAGELALNGTAKAAPLIRDDLGGVLIGAGRIGPVRGVGYCDEQQVLRGQAGTIQVTPDPGNGPGLLVTVVRRGLLGKRISTASGRAFQLGCMPTAPRYDGIQHPRTVNRWTWYRHTEDLLLIR